MTQTKKKKKIDIFRCFGHSVIEIWNLFVICYLVLGILFSIRISLA